MSLPSKREFLVAAGLATGDRGRFSSDAEAFAAANTDKWQAVAKPVKAAAPRPTVTTSTGTRVVPTPKVSSEGLNGKAVRQWAKAQGLAVGERGRMPSDVIAAYVQAHGKGVPGPAAKRPTPMLMPKVRRESTGFTVVGGTLIRQDTCGHCTAQVSRCACSTGPRARKFIEKDHGGILPLTLDKPDL